MTRYARLIGLILTLMLVLTSILGVCGSALAEGAPTKITFFSSRGESEDVVRAIKQVAEQYIAEGHNVEFVVETAADEATYWQKLRAMAAANELPTLFDCDPTDFMKEMVDNDMLVDMQAYLEEIGQSENFYSLALNYVRQNDGTLYALPFEMSIEMIWYNVDMFEACGLTAPKTFDDFLNCCKVLKENGYQPIAINGVDSWCLMRYLGNVPFRLAANDYTAGLANGTNKMNEDIGMKALQFVADCGQYFQPGFASCDFMTAENMFLEGKAAIYEMGSWELNNFIPAVENGMNFDYFYMPTCDGAVTNPNEYWAFGGIGMCAAKDKFNDDVKDFLKYLVENYSYTYTAMQHFAAQPVSVEQLEADGYSFHPLFYRMLGDLAEIGERSCRPWDVVLPTTVTTVIADNLNSVAMGYITPEDMAAMIDAELETVLAK